jgi:hypothetical protein
VLDAPITENEIRLQSSRPPQQISRNGWFIGGILRLELGVCERGSYDYVQHDVSAWADDKCTKTRHNNMYSKERRSNTGQRLPATHLIKHGLQDLCPCISELHEINLA